MDSHADQIQSCAWAPAAELTPQTLQLALLAQHMAGWLRTGWLQVWLVMKTLLKISECCHTSEYCSQRGLTRPPLFTGSSRPRGSKPGVY
jgi:hypothetical protein